MEIRKILLGTAVLLAAVSSCVKDPSGQGNGNTNPDVISGNIQGTVVSSSGDPIEGVVVSDGLHCTKTNAKGEWGLEADLKNTDYVFVSTPSNYSAPLVEGVPVFWKFLSELTPKDGKYTDVKFILDKINSPERFTILMYADPQPRGSTAKYDNLAYHSLECCEDMYKDMKEVVQSISGKLVYSIGLGDIVHRELKLLPRHKSGMASTGARNYNVIGNHDHDVSKKTDDRDAARPFEAILGPVNYSFNIGNLHILVLDDMIAPLVDGYISDSCATGLTDEIWQWMQNDLSFVSKDKVIMVCAHSPMFRVAGGSNRTSAKHYADYRSLLSKYKKVYAWAGHTHSTLNYVDVEDPVIETHTLTRTTGELWTNEYLGANGTPRGYVVVNYDNGEVTWYFKPTYYQSGKFITTYNSGKQPEYAYRDWDYVNGRAVMRGSGKNLDDKYQMQVFGPTLYGDGYIYANIFMWDELWSKPRFTVDGIPKAMTRVTAKNYKYSYSAWEIRNFYTTYNTVLSKDDYNVDLNSTESVFRVFVESEHGSGTVSVEDRFHNVYSSTITW